MTTLVVGMREGKLLPSESNSHVVKLGYSSFPLPPFRLLNVQQRNVLSGIFVLGKLISTSSHICSSLRSPQPTSLPLLCRVSATTKHCRNDDRRLRGSSPGKFRQPETPRRLLQHNNCRRSINYPLSSGAKYLRMRICSHRLPVDRPPPVSGLVREGSPGLLAHRHGALAGDSRPEWDVVLDARAEMSLH